ncbi:hypothetical protein PAXRUDRAFT_22140 [Paxillus rubicundulus Ve08.2h10]|uniref:Unplaced genomic scaffold scaffold_6158, whole genome shotgun sequence n=1 Tax=Paxillus rubicundulus Ve08.2h10 TaxID=930991 RepID=A0A0D0C9K2_9AGAM|nr:hypothetical protein PAXRUDRAFT_22140 [Paxillus rubicundulus Ve08.2h10]
MDGNFKAEHMYEKKPDDQVFLMDGKGYMVGWKKYHDYLKAAKDSPERSDCIRRKLKIALISKEQAADAFQALDEGLPADWKRPLVKQERKAMNEREGNPEAMDVYNLVGLQ